MIFLSGEATTIAEAEARAVVSAYDPLAEVSLAEERVLLARTSSPPETIAARIAFSRRVGESIPDGRLEPEHLRALEAGTYRVKVYDLGAAHDDDDVVGLVAGQVGAKVSLKHPDREVTVVRGRRDYYLLSRPGGMRQGWVRRRPRSRAFFHPAAIFPKLSRALVNLSRVVEGEVFLDPFCGTGSLLIEAQEIGALPLGIDIDRRMASGAHRNMKKLGHDWLGIVRADARLAPVRRASAAATDVPYGRASSTGNSHTAEIMASLIRAADGFIPSGRRLVVMHPQTVALPKDGSFRLEEEHQLYIHSKLTRSISVLRRI